MTVRLILPLASFVAVAPLFAQSTPSSNDVQRAQYIVIQDAEFRKMDADKNGQVSKAEVEAFLRMAAVATAQARNRQLFAELDGDRNGQLSPAEFLKLNPPNPPIDGQPIFAQYDLDRNGQISLVEHRTGKLANFDRLDTDKDGVVTVAEMKAGGIIK